MQFPDRLALLLDAAGRHLSYEKTSHFRRKKKNFGALAIRSADRRKIDPSYKTGFGGSYVAQDFEPGAQMEAK
ncbi:MAG: hypothetical protein DMG39_01960 [Acidobacteria bacterium]|nr:MAG: hypothetical protein DMG39_01960 [Acidobacteriota bacterium]